MSNIEVKEATSAALQGTLGSLYGGRERLPPAQQLHGMHAASTHRSCGCLVFALLALCPPTLQQQYHDEARTL